MIKALSGPFIDKTSPLEKEYRCRRDAYQAVWNGRRLDEIVLPFNPKEREFFIEAFMTAMDILDH
jgi:hypothetical protein